MGRLLLTACFVSRFRRGATATKSKGSAKKAKNKKKKASPFPDPGAISVAAPPPEVPAVDGPTTLRAEACKELKGVFELLSKAEGFANNIKGSLKNIKEDPVIELTENIGRVEAYLQSLECSTDDMSEKLKKLGNLLKYSRISFDATIQLSSYTGAELTVASMGLQHPFSERRVDYLTVNGSPPTQVLAVDAPTTLRAEASNEQIGAVGYLSMVKHWAKSFKSLITKMKEESINELEGNIKSVEDKFEFLQWSITDMSENMEKLEKLVEYQGVSFDATVQLPSTLRMDRRLRPIELFPLVVLGTPSEEKSDTNMDGRATVPIKQESI